MGVIQELKDAWAESDRLRTENERLREQTGDIDVRPLDSVFSENLALRSLLKEAGEWMSVVARLFVPGGFNEYESELVQRIQEATK